MTVSLTESAAAQVQKVLAKQGQGIGLRLGVKTSGCAGLAYVLEFSDAPNADEHAYTSHGITVLVAPESLQYLDGMVVDYVREGINQSFKFINPNVKDQCGCGGSFNV